MTAGLQRGATRSGKPQCGRSRGELPGAFGILLVHSGIVTELPDANRSGLAGQGPIRV